MARQQKEKAVFTPPTSRVDLERRLADDYRSPYDRRAVAEPVDVDAPYAVEDNDTSAYLGVSPEYMTYANDTEKPLRATKGVEEKLEEKVRQGSAVGTDDPRGSKQTLGGGSNSELVYSATSGEDFTTEKIDRKAVAKEQEKKAEDANAAEQVSTPGNPVTVEPVQTGESSSPEEAPKVTAE